MKIFAFHCQPLLFGGLSLLICSLFLFLLAGDACAATESRPNVIYIMSRLAELNLDKTTLVIFCSDNGATSAGGADPDFFDNNGPYRGIKRDLYEGRIITPMIARWPERIAAGSTTDHVSGFQDLLPTMAELVGVDAPKSIDGISYLPTSLGRSTDQSLHDHLYWEFVEQGGKRALRKGNWKLVQRNVSKRTPNDVELYDLSKDIAESNNLAQQNPDIVAKLTAIMDAQHTPSKLFPLFFDEGAGKRKKNPSKK